jgi:adenylate cyclase
VNTAQRIEERAKDYMTDDEEAVVLVSEVVLQSVRSPGSAQPVGRHILRGRQEATNVFKLL